MLVNPTGKRDHFRAVDWMVELLNLYTKVDLGAIIVSHKPLAHT